VGAAICGRWLLLGSFLPTVPGCAKARPLCIGKIFSTYAHFVGGEEDMDSIQKTMKVRQACSFPLSLQPQRAYSRESARQTARVLVRCFWRPSRASPLQCLFGLCCLLRAQRVDQAARGPKHSLTSFARNCPCPCAPGGAALLHVSLSGLRHAAASSIQHQALPSAAEAAKDCESEFASPAGPVAIVT